VGKKKKKHGIALGFWWSTASNLRPYGRNAHIICIGTEGTPHTLKSSLKEGYNFTIMVNVLAKHPQENHHNIQNSPY
jgi:hypothetical protein